VKAHIGFRDKGMDVIGGNEGYQPREGSAPYNVLFGAGNADIGLENTFLWGVNNE
jgi:hypothetical protein